MNNHDLNVLTSVHVMKHEQMPEDWKPSSDKVHAHSLLEKLGVPSGCDAIFEKDKEGVEHIVGVKCWIGEGDQRVEASAEYPVGQCNTSVAICRAALKYAGVSE